MTSPEFSLVTESFNVTDGQSFSSLHAALAALSTIAARNDAEILITDAVGDGRVQQLVAASCVPVRVIDAYVASGDAFGKAGAYAIQSGLAGWIEHIDGSHSGIMGLPLFETAQLLHAAGVGLAL